jgi:hypothetical protein
MKRLPKNSIAKFSMDAVKEHEVCDWSARTMSILSNLVGTRSTASPTNRPGARSIAPLDPTRGAMLRAPSPNYAHLNKLTHHCRPPFASNRVIRGETKNYPNGAMTRTAPHR